MNRTVVIGDIHGCHAELCALLDAVGPSPGDSIIALGDIVDRGPDSERVLEFFRDTPHAHSLLGNHERSHIRSAASLIRPVLSQRIVRQQLGLRYAWWIEFMREFPVYIELPEAVLVHGFLAPGIPLEQQLESVLVGSLSGERRITSSVPSPWYEHLDAAKPLVFGHHDYLRNGQPVIREGRAYGIDTGAAHGGRLTALVLPDFRIVSVPAAEDYWRIARRAFAGPADRSRFDERS